MSDEVLVEVAVGHFRQIPLPEVLVAGGRRKGRKTWPSGLVEDVYELPCSRRGPDGPRLVNGENKVVLTERERKSFERYIGEPVRDMQDAKRKMKAKGLRFLEKGEKFNDYMDENIDYADSAGEKNGAAPPQFPGWDKLGLLPTPKPFDHEARLAHWRRVFGE